MPHVSDNVLRSLEEAKFQVSRGKWRSF